jgi:hypothetical protein
MTIIFGILDRTNSGSNCTRIYIEGVRVALNGNSKNRNDISEVINVKIEKQKKEQVYIKAFHKLSKF